MKRVKNNSKVAMLAVMFAMVFTFNACSDDNSDDGGGFNENSQIFNEDGRQSNISGTIKVSLYWQNESDNGWESGDTLINAGNVTNGVVSLKLPEIIPDKFLHPVGNIWEEEDGCTISDKSVKISEPLRFDLYNGNENVGYLDAMYIDAETFEVIWYVYASKAVNINCNYKGDKGTMTANLKYVKGFNKSYSVRDSRNGKYSTDNILTKEVKWILKSDNHSK
jgi:hypothetical protein